MDRAKVIVAFEIVVVAVYLLILYRLKRNQLTQRYKRKCARLGHEREFGEDSCMCGACEYWD